MELGPLDEGVEEARGGVMCVSNSPRLESPSRLKYC